MFSHVLLFFPFPCGLNWSGVRIKGYNQNVTSGAMIIFPLLTVCGRNDREYVGQEKKIM